MHLPSRKLVKTQITSDFSFCLLVTVPFLSFIRKLSKENEPSSSSNHLRDETYRKRNFFFHIFYRIFYSLAIKSQAVNVDLMERHA